MDTAGLKLVRFKSGVLVDGMGGWMVGWMVRVMGEGYYGTLL